jgi:hypothetical protein
MKNYTLGAWLRYKWLDLKRAVHLFFDRPITIEVAHVYPSTVRDILARINYHVPPHLFRTFVERVATAYEEDIYTILDNAYTNDENPLEKVIESVYEDLFLLNKKEARGTWI